jgi:hypothetical protein
LLASDHRATQEAMIQRAKAHKRPPEKIAPKTPLVPCGTEATDPVENDPFIAFGKAMIQSVGLAARLKASSTPVGIIPPHKLISSVDFAHMRSAMVCGFRLLGLRFACQQTRKKIIDEVFCSSVSLITAHEEHCLNDKIAVTERL